MVATSHPEASRVGADVLRSGGNAVDAAIAANAALSVIEPAMCGLGGDLMAMVWDAKTRGLAGYNGSGRSPRALTLEAFRERGLARIPERHPLTWTVPGCAEGWARLSERFGSRPLRDLLAPAIRLADEGCAVPPIIARDWAATQSAGADSFARTFLPGGRPPRAGEIFLNSDLGATLRRVAEDWQDFYTGEIARRLAEFSRAEGGLLTEEDLAGHAGEWVEPLSTDHRGHTVWALPPNTQGLCVLEMINMLEAEDLAAFPWRSAERLHRMIEAKKLAFEDRARHIADPAHAALPTERLVSKEHARRRWERFDPDRAGQAFESDLPGGEDTTYLCTADADGNAVSLIQSIYMGFGSGFVPEGLGFCLQNRGLGFSLDPDHPCCAAPAKRPLHTIIPGFVTRDGRPWLCFGVMGGTMQPQGQVQILTNMIDFGLDVQAAGEVPRFRHEGSSDVDGHRMTDGGIVHLEHSFGDAALAGLERRGHRLAPDLGSLGGLFGGYQGIFFDHGRGVLLGGSDRRKDGCALGL